MSDLQDDSQDKQQPADDDKNSRHQKRMERKKAIIDDKIKQADIERGITILIKGNGKGKSSSAFGMVARSVGHGMKVGVVQFIKGKWQCGEQLMFTDHPQVEFAVMGTGFTWDTQDRQADIDAAVSTWIHAERMLADPTIELVVLDEITYMYQYGYLPLEKLLTALEQRPANQHVVITGRAAHADLEAVCDTVSEIKDVAHAFRAGVKAQKGVDW
ncbi:MAG: cob(I)yrinic acid a,c-diamide adenosyltransferase [Motiliproteus sp.]